MKTLISLSLCLILLQGCLSTKTSSRDEARKDAQKASVIAFCSTEIQSNQLFHKIAEIWRDNSGGAFQLRIGDGINDPIPTNSQFFSAGQTALVFYHMTNGQPEKYLTTYFYNGECVVWPGLNKEQVRSELMK